MTEKNEFYECEIDGMYQVSPDIPDRMYCDVCSKQAKKIRKPGKPAQNHTWWLSLIIESFFEEFITLKGMKAYVVKDFVTHLAYLREYFEKERSYHQHGEDIKQSLKMGLNLKDLMDQFQTQGLDISNVRVRLE